MRKTFGLIVALAVLAGVAVVHLRAAGNDASPAVGSTAPAFSLTDQTGKTVSLSDFAGKVVVLEWFNEACPFVQRHYKAGDISDTASKYAANGVVWLAINSTNGSTTSGNKVAAENWNMSRPILNDADGTTGHAYGAKNTPELFIIGTDGKLDYEGAIDNDPTGDKTSGKVNYVAKALDELLSGKPVSEPQTKPYGCTVHYTK